MPNEKLAAVFLIPAAAIVFLVLYLNFTKKFVPEVKSDTASYKEEEKIDTEVENSNVTPVENPQINLESEIKLPIKKTKIIDFGLITKDYSNSTGEITDFQTKTGKTVDYLSIYKHMGDETSKYLTQAELTYIKTTNKKLIIAWEPWNPAESLNQSKNYLLDIANGTEDAYITQFANEVKNSNVPTIIRFAHEMNGNWYPWGNKPNEYINAYKHIVTKFRDLGVTNAYWMWNINVGSVPVEPIESVSQYYPGYDYVDYVGIDGFNFGNTTNWSSWTEFEDLFHKTYNHVVHVYNKPVIIAETSSTEHGGSKSDWIKNMDITLQKETFSNIQAVIWFNIIKETDWRIDSSEISLTNFKDTRSFD